MPTAQELAAFARACLPHYFPLPFSALHEYLLARHAARTALPPARRAGGLDVVLAPRGAAKSTLVALLFPLHALLTGREPYMLLISATLTQAVRRLACLRGVLARPGPWQAQFPEAAGWPLKATLRALELGAGRIEACSAGTELRGLSHGPHRPTWIILDDIERGDRVHSARCREQLFDWFREVIENLGAPGTQIDLIGTLLHPDALPARLLQRHDVVGRSFPSILAEAERHDLWDAWRAQLTNPADADRLATARAFFEGQRGEMLRGAEVLWPAREDYYALQSLRVRLGRAAFDKEKQNRPALGGEAWFKAAHLRRFTLRAGQLELEAGRHGAPDPAPCRRLEELRVIGFLDPALGTPHGDFAAIVTLGLAHDDLLFVLDAWLARVPHAAQVERILELHAQWNYEVFGLESVSFQKLLLEPIEAEKQRRRARGEPWQLPVVTSRPAGPKQARISALEPAISSGWLLFSSTLGGEFLQQVLDFPHARHDDGPDALAGAVRLAKERGPVPSPRPLARPGQRGY